MLINLHQSELFTKEPAIRFAIQYDVPVELWENMWRKYKIYEYTTSDLREYYQMKTGRRIRNQVIYRWIFRTEIYAKTKPIMKDGVRTVNSTFFGNLEKKVIDELFKHMKSGDTKDCRILA